MTIGVARLPVAAISLVVSLGLATLPSCDSSPSSRGSGGPVVVDDATPDALLASLKAAARESLNRYYEAMRDSTDCDALPEMCRLLTARADSARELVALRNAMANAYGAAGAEAGADMLRGAFLEEYEAIERAGVFTGSGDIAILRIGTAVYRMRRLEGGWRIVQFPDPPYDPAASADAIEIVVARAAVIRKDVESGRISDLDDLERRLAGVIGG